MNEQTGLVPRSLIGSLCRDRDEAIEIAAEGAQMLSDAHALNTKANALASRATLGTNFYGNQSDNKLVDAMTSDKFDVEKTVAAFTRLTDARAWTYLIDRVGIKTMMDKQAKEEFDKSLLDDVPELNIENIDATINQLIADSGMIFQRGLANCFTKLDKRFKSHDGFKIGSRIILDRVFDEHGHWNYHGKMRETIMDVERVFAVLDGNNPDGDSLIREIENSRGSGYEARQSECQSQYFKIVGYKNGNAHLWFMRDDLVKKANKILAEFYGEVLPDGVEPDETDLTRDRTNLPSKDLAFYATPEPVIAKMINNLSFGKGARILEPSAGTGNITEALIAAGANVTAVEIDPDRCAVLKRRTGSHAICINTNFLDMKSQPTFDFVFMNPPFYGTHWIDHITKAFEFLVPGGRLISVVPSSAEYGETKRHTAFKKWAKPYFDTWCPFRDLPAESFLESGTRINTCLLELRKPHA